MSQPTKSRDHQDGQPAGAEPQAGLIADLTKAQLLSLILYLPDIVIVSRLSDGMVLEANQLLLDALGYERQEVVGHTSMELGWWPTAEERQAIIDSLLAIGSFGPLETSYRHKDGHLIPSLISGRLVQLEGEGLVITIGRDITQQKMAEQAMVEREQLQRTFFEDNHSVMLLIDPETAEIIDANQAACFFYGYSKQELTSLRITDINTLAPDQLFEEMAKVKKGQRKRYHFRHRLADGQVRQVEVYTGPLKLGGRTLLCSTVYDITERMKAEQALRESEKRYRETFNNIRDLVYTQDLQGRFTGVNAAVTRILGYSEDELLGLCPADFMKPELRQAFFEEYLETIKREGSYEGVSSYFRKDGTSCYLEYRSVIVSPEGGEPYISGIGREVTERIMTERQLKKLQDQLLQAQKLEAVGTLASGVAHDFNNILQAIRGYVELMARQKGAAAPQHRYLEEIEQATTRAGELVQGLLTFSRKVETERKPVDFNQAVFHAVRLLERTLPKMIHIEARLADNLRMVNGDLSQLEQVVMNLGANARDAMPEGGRLLLETKNITLDRDSGPELLDAQPGDYVLLIVSDTGKGLSPETAQHIFEPFFTTKEVGQGTGLGLSTAYGIIRAHNGHITCNSQTDQGATFSVYLPALDMTSTQALEQGKPPEPVRGGRETILMVDDEKPILEAMREMLRHNGYQVLTAGSGEEALELYQESELPVNLVVLDLGMPGMGGNRALEELLKLDPRAKVVIASGYATRSQAEQSLKKGAAGFLAKPYRSEDMLRLIRRVLEDPESSARD